MTTSKMTSPGYYRIEWGEDAHNPSPMVGAMRVIRRVPGGAHLVDLTTNFSHRDKYNRVLMLDREATEHINRIASGKGAPISKEQFECLWHLYVGRPYNP